MAIGALQACAELDLHVPETVAIVGYDDIPVARLVRPALTTVGLQVTVSKSALGAHAVRLLLKHLAGDQEGSELVLTPQLVVRASAP